MRNVFICGIFIASFLVFALPVSAHVVVKPNQVGTAERVNFVVSVPTEEDNPTVAIRLIIPEGIKSARPNVKPGWTIQLKKTGEGESTRVAEIIWSGGSIPAEQRDEFMFSTQVSAEETTLVWKAYQTYSDGDIVSWETDPKVVAEYTKNNPPKEGEGDHNAPRPYSETNVVNDLAKGTTEVKETSGTGNNNALLLSVVAVILGAAALGMQFMKQ